jgi:putative tricarboxylic transport membrane protein
MKVTRIISLIFLVLFVFILNNLYNKQETSYKYPSKPITLVVHVNPGSGIDIMSRKVAEIARKKFNVIMTVENMLGTQGLRAMEHTLKQQRDGYTLLSVTTGFISTLLVNQASVDIDDFLFVGLMLEDAEALIINKTAEVNNFSSILEKGRTWIGPGTGGRDHLMAIKSWEAFNLNDATWTSYSTGPQSVLALMREEGEVYVGNALDIRGKTDSLALAAVASPKRLEAFPDVPTFTELGFNMEEYMWRGFAFAKNTPKEAVLFIENLLYQISLTDEWQEYVKQLFCYPTFKGHNDFQKIVHKESKETLRLLQKANLLTNYKKLSNNVLIFLGLSIFFITTIILLLIQFLKKKKLTQTIWISSYLIATSLFFLLQINDFDIPTDINITHPGTIPGLWSILIIIFCLVLLILNKEKIVKEKTKTETNKTILTIFLVSVYFLTINFFGYYITSLFFIILLPFILGENNKNLVINTAFGFVLLSYFLFEIVLNVSLPLGVLLS